MNIQKQYWKFLQQLKFSIFYLNRYSDSSYKWDRKINIFTAIASSSSIAAWVIWTKYAFVWSAIIAVSQVINVIKIYLPFSTRLEIINPFIYDLQTLYSEAEYKWFRVANGELEEDEINEELYQLNIEYNSTQQHYTKTNIFVDNKKFKAIANEQTAEFFKNF
ncbi:MAG: hypothetical protein EOM05_05400 [Clostridia bacterium]|nr:hypothetical protein [Clostridia bacterium]